MKYGDLVGQRETDIAGQKFLIERRCYALKTNINFKYAERFSSYRAVNIFHH
jgi:hypothetical protein